MRAGRIRALRPRRQTAPATKATTAGAKPQNTAATLGTWW